jgi:hypothetical protein
MRHSARLMGSRPLKSVARSSATLAIVVSMNLPIAPFSSGRSANRTSTPESISFNTHCGRKTAPDGQC